MQLHPFLPGFRARPGTSSPADHWQGGDNTFPGARCPSCRQPLLLLWNLNARDPRFRRLSPPHKDAPQRDGNAMCSAAFGALTRVPLFYCWKCAGELWYRVLPDQQVEIAKHKGAKKKPAHPYRPYPKALEHRPLELEAMPPHIWKIVSGFSTDRYGDTLADADKETLSAWFGHRVETSLDLWCHQFGGIPWLLQGPEKVPCVHKQCSRGKRRWPMKILAAIHNDPAAGLPLVESASRHKDAGADHNTQALFHICETCLTLHACSRDE